MKTTTGMALVALLAWTAAGFAQSASAPAKPLAAKTFRARLSPVPLDAGMMATITGMGTVTATLAGTKLSLSGTYENLQTPATTARVHKGVKTGVRGDAAFDLKVSGGTSGTISGSVDLTPMQVADLEQGRLYVQLHSEKAPEGNLWGWLLSRESAR